MKRSISMLFFFWLATAVIFSAAVATESSAAQLPFSKARIIFEFNSSGPDLGIQVSLDGEPWSEIKIVDPQGRAILEIEAAGRLKKFGLTELFAESNEPNFIEDVPAQEILDRFPAGVYKFFGKTVEGDRRGDAHARYSGRAVRGLGAGDQRQSRHQLGPLPCGFFANRFASCY